ncbi:MAG: HD-GYP domain-containing protein [Actinomycetota bacterium]
MSVDRDLLRELERLKLELERERTAAAELYAEANREVLRVVIDLAEYRDDDTRLHTRRVGDTSALLAAKIGLPNDVVQDIRHAAPMHDIGKVAVSDATLLKRGPLTPQEFQEVQLHSIVGARVTWGRKLPVLKIAHEIALCHHERWDGSGYPVQFSGTEIPLSARIVAVADVFDALTHERPYKPAWSIEQSLVELVKQRGSHFDPELVDAFEELIRGGALETIEWA